LEAFTQKLTFNIIIMQYEVKLLNLAYSSLWINHIEIQKFIDYDSFSYQHLQPCVFYPKLLIVSLHSWLNYIHYRVCYSIHSRYNFHKQNHCYSICIQLPQRYYQIHYLTDLMLLQSKTLLTTRWLDKKKNLLLPSLKIQSIKLFKFLNMH
jgi:hypothetical protein